MPRGKMENVLPGKAGRSSPAECRCVLKDRGESAQAKKSFVRFKWDAVMYLADEMMKMRLLVLFMVQKETGFGCVHLL